MTDDVLTVSTDCGLESHRTIRAIMERHGVRCSLGEFHHAVNVTFHQFESEVYDRLHADMWASLPRQFALLTEDCLNRYPDMPRKLHVLDVGCGTGFAAESILKTAFGERVAAIDLLDTSPAMLRRASGRAAQWGVPITCHEGTLETVAAARQYELIVVCSVLHHVPDLVGFCDVVRKLQAHGGIFLHLQDPNEDCAGDPELRLRRERLSKRSVPKWASRFTPRRILGRLSRELRGEQGRNHLSRTNRALLEAGIIDTPLDIGDIYAITDLHDRKGISVTRMKSWMPGYECLAQRSYAFFGELWSKLPPDLKRVEEDLIAQGASNGQYVGAIWKLRQAAPSGDMNPLRSAPGGPR